MFGNKIDPIATDNQLTLSHHFLETMDFDTNSYGFNLFDIIFLILAIGVLGWVKYQESYGLAFTSG